MRPWPPVCPRPTRLLGGLSFLLLPALLAGQTADARPCEGVSGPLGVVNESPLRQPFYHARPVSACPPRHAGLELRLLAANQFYDGRQGSRWVFLDAETYRIDVVASIPLTAERVLRIELPFHSRATGILDGPIEFWHGTLGLPQGTRVDYERNRVRYLLGSEQGSRDMRSLLADSDRSAGPGDVTITLLQALSDARGRSAAALRGGVKLPVGRSRDFFGSGGTDVALGIVWTTRLASRVWAHGNFDVVAIGESPLEGAGLSRAETASRLLVGVEWLAGTRTRLLLQALSETSPLEVGVGYLDRESLLVALGVRQLLGSGLEAEVAIAEDLRTQTAPDVALQAALRWQSR